MTMIRTVIDQVSRMDAEELNRVVEAVKLRRTFIAKESARGLFIGDAVSFTSKRGQTVQGTVTKVNSKTVVVDTVHDGRWKVTASMLTLVAAQLYPLGGAELRKVASNLDNTVEQERYSINLLYLFSFVINKKNKKKYFSGWGL